MCRQTIVFAFILTFALSAYKGMAQSYTDSLQGVYVGSKSSGIDFKPITYDGPATLFVYKASIQNKIHIKHHQYNSYQELLDYETDSIGYLLTVDSAYNFSEDSTPGRIRAGNFNKGQLHYRHRPPGPSNSINYYYDCQKSDDMTLSIDKKPENQAFILYPNPSHGILNIKNNVESDYEIFNLKGELLLQGHNTNNIDISSLQSGEYIIKLAPNLAYKFLKN